MNRKGFTLTELIGVIVIIAIILSLAVVSFIGIRNSVLEKQYDNLVTYIASKAASYSEETGELNVTIERLIETGFVEADNDNIIKDPRNNNNINCYMFNSKYENGNYNAILGNDIGLDENGKCNKYEVTKEMQICVMENGVCNTAIASWYNKNITLSVLIGNNPELINNAEVVWRVNGEVINSKTYETNISSINKGIYYADIKYEELRPDGTSKVIQGTESVAINIDLEKPIVRSITINKETQWTNSNKKTTIKMSDNNGSGIAGLAIVVGTKYCNDIGPGEWNIQMEDTYNVELDIGSYNVCVQDLAGNISDDNLFEIKKVDKIAPTCEINTTLMPDGENGWYVSKPINVKLSYNDNIEENISHGLRINNSSVYYNNEDEYNHNTDTSSATYYGFVKDVAGNENTCSKEIKVDTTNPSCNIKVTGEKKINGSEWYTSNVTIELEENKGTSDISKHDLSTSTAINYKDKNIDITKTEGNTTGITYYGYVKGESGLEGSCSKTNIKVDTINPEIGSISTEETGTTGSMKIKTTVTDNGSKLSGYAVTNSSSIPTNWTNISGTPINYEISQTVNSSGTYYVWVKDVAGNIASSETSVIVSYTQTTQVRYENANGTWSNYTTVETKNVSYGSSYSWSTSQISNFDSTTYQEANVASYTVTGAKTNQVSIYRKTFTCKIGYKLQKSDGTYESEVNAVNTTLRYGDTCSWSRTADTTYQAASYSSMITGNINQTINVNRKEVTCTKQYRLQKSDGTWGSYIADGTTTTLYGGNCSYTKSVTNYKGTSGGTNDSTGTVNATNVTGNQTLSISMYRNTFICNKQYRLEKVDGTWENYVSDGNETVLYEGNCSYTKSVTNYKGSANGANGSAGTANATNVTSNQTLSVNMYRNTFTCKIDYKLQKADGTYENAVNAVNKTLRYGDTCSYSRTADVTYKAASYSSAITGNINQTVNVDRNTFTCKIDYKLQKADGTYENAINAVNKTLRYGDTCSYSRTADVTYKAASYSSAITSNINQTVNVNRNTFTCTKQYRLQKEDGTWGSYTADGSDTVLYGGDCNYTKSVTNYKGSATGTNGSAGTASASNVMSNQTLSISMYRNTFTCSQRYRLQNADGTWGSYTADGSATALYGGKCSYTRSITSYKGSSDGANDSSGTNSASSVTSAQTLSLDFYRNTYTLTVTPGTNTSSATGGGTKRWGQSCTVGVTKAANTTCISYATPTWTASSGTAPAAGASSTYTMPKSNATVTATSAASNVSQTITLSKGTGVSGIKIGSTNYTGASASLTCGTYNISGNLNAGYSFLSWARANGVTVASTSTASTTMTVSGPGTLTLNGKANTYNLVITGDDGVSGFSVKVGSTSGTTITCTKSGNNYTCSSLANGTNYYLYPTFNSGFSFGSYTKTDSATNAQLGATDAQNTYYKMGVGAGAITISSKLGLCDDLDHCMQTATMENCGNTKKDARDGKSYTTAIIGTECWMTKNLSLAGGTALTSVLSNVASSYVIPASDCSASYGSDPVGTFMCNDQWGKGAYYSWNIAVAGSATVPTYGPDNPAPSDLTYENVAPYDICPKRWKLPTSFGQISNAVCERDGRTRYCYPTGSPFYGELNGHPLYSGQDRIGDFGFIWSSTYSPRVYGCEVVNGQVGCGYAGGINSLYIRSNMFTYQSVTSGHAKGIRCILKDN